MKPRAFEIQHCSGQSGHIGALGSAVWTMMSKWQGHLVFCLRLGERFPRAYRIHTILHLLSDLGMCRKSFVASHGEVNFLGRNREKTGVLKKQHPQYLESKSGLPREAVFQDRFPSYVQHIAARWKTSVLLPQIGLAGRAWASGGSNKKNVGGGNLFSFCSASHRQFPSHGSWALQLCENISPACWAMAPKFLKGCSGYHSNQEPEKPRVWFMERISMLPSVCASHSWCVHTSAHTALHRRGFMQKIKIKYNLILPVIDNKLIKPN